MSIMNVVERFLWARARYADRVAIEGGSSAWTYERLDAESSAVCGFLRERGIGKGDLIPVLMQRSPGFVVAALGIIRSGAAFAPIDLSSPPSRRAQILAGVPFRLAIRDDAVDAPEAADARAVHIEEALRGLPPSSTPDSIHPDDPLYVMYTSGTTGAPKGVVIPHRGVVRLVVDADWSEFDHTFRWLLNSSIAFDASTLEIWGPLLNGAACIVQEKPLISLDELARYFVEKRISDSWLTGSLFNAMVDTHLEAFRGVRQLCTGGERESPQHMRTFVTAHPHVRLIHGYGPTENTVFSHTHRVTPTDTQPGKRVPIGRPIRGTIDLIERPDGSEAGIGEPGELVVGGLGVGLGYKDDLELTARKFITLRGERWYRTGDQVVRRPDGAVEFIGRLDRQVKIRGNRIELDEVEAIMRECPDVGDVCVFVDGDTAQSKRIFACYTGRPGTEGRDERIRAFLKERLPRVMVPSILRRVERFPLKSSGKVDEARLRELAASTPADAEPLKQEQCEVGWTPTERALALLWRRRLPGVLVRRKSSLLDLGGHSLLAMRLAADIAVEFQRTLSPARLLEAESLADVARFIDCVPREQTDTHAEQPARRAPAGDESPAAGIRQRLLAASHLDSSGDAYIVPVAFTLPSVVPIELIRDSFRTLIERHEMLRYASNDADAAAEKVHAAPPEGWWTAHKNTIEVPAGSWPDAILHRIYRPLDPATGGPTRIDVWPAAGSNWLVIWTTHHAVIDEWSIRLLLEQFVGLLGGRPVTTTGDPRAFFDRERHLADAEKARQQAADIAGALGEVSIPFTNWSGPATEIDLPIDDGIVSALADVARRTGATRVAPALAAYGLAIQEVLGAAWRFVSTPIAKRHSPDLIDSVNCCLEMRVVECGARAGESAGALVRRVRDELVSCQDRGFVPFDIITTELRHRRADLAAAPMQFGFTWRRDPCPVIPLADPGAGAAGLPGELRTLRVPQMTTVFGCTLHIEEAAGSLRARFEVCGECAASGVARRLALAFRESVLRLAVAPEMKACAATDLNAATPGKEWIDPDQVQHSGDATTAGTVLAGVVSECWKEVLGTAPESDRADFFDAGGTSLSLLRLVAMIRQKTGSTIDGGRALAKSTFEDICENVFDSTLKDRRTWIQLGDPAARHTLLILPGNAGYALGMCRLVESICEAAPVPLRCVVIDLLDIWRLVGKPHRVDEVVDRVIRALGEAGVARPWGIVGYSLGGPLAVAVEQRLASMERPSSRLWIIDGYAPMLMRRDLHIRAMRKFATVARRAWGRVRGARVIPARTEADDPADWLVCGAFRDANAEVDRAAFQQQLGLMRLRYCDADVVIVRSAIMGRKVNIIGRGATNGFDPALFRSLRVESAEYFHLELVKEQAAWTAGIIANTLGLRAGSEGV